MCGIAGEIRPAGQVASVAAVETMTAALAPRGPDGEGLWSNGAVALGHRRLKVIDLTSAGSQPMVDAELGLTVVFNGCIYNHRQLRRELEGFGYRFFSSSDTEVITKAWHRWGQAALDRLFGMFAFVVVERDTGRVTLVRDRLGIKPLYVADAPGPSGGLRFASTLPALVAPGGVDTTVDPVALHHYLSFHSVVPGDRTILSGVRRLPAASLMVVEPDGSRRERRWWRNDYRRDETHRGWNERDWQDAVYDTLRTAVKRRLEADVPVGVLLSGGVDSSLVVALLAEQGQKGLETFSIGFDAVGAHEGDEFRYSDLVAERFGTSHHRIHIPAGAVVPALGDAIAAMSEPMMSHDVVAFHLLGREVSKHLKVVQSGQGADEVFAGYRWYPPMADAPLADAVAIYQTAFFDRSHEAINALVGPDYRCATDPSVEFVSREFHRSGAQTPLDRALRLDTEVMLVDDPVKRVDNMTMDWGLEARVPFLDHEVVELAAKCPDELRLADGGKGVLKGAARRIVPGEVIDRPKGYFPVPSLTHLDGSVVELLADALGSQAARDRKLFDPQAIESLLADPNGSLTPLHGNPLWQVGLVELWLQHHGL